MIGSRELKSNKDGDSYNKMIQSIASKDTTTDNKSVDRSITSLFFKNFSLKRFLNFVVNDLLPFNPIKVRQHTYVLK